MKKQKPKKPKSNITIHTNQSNNSIIKEFFFIYQYSNDIPCHFQIDSKYYCYYLSLKFHETNPMYISSALKNTSEKTKLKPRFLFLLFDYVSSIEEKSSIDAAISSPIFQINANLFNTNNQSELLFSNHKDNESLSLLNDSKIEKMLLDINIICIKMNVCFILCFSGKDVAQYIYLLSMLDNDNYNTRKKAMNVVTTNDELIEAICYIDLIKKKNANNILMNFKDITGIGLANKSSLSSITKINNDKANSIFEFFNYEFSQLNSQ